jgi:Flp pilus assembly protein protease CpaA
LLTLPLLALGLVQAGVFAGSRGLVDALLGCALAGFPYVLLFLYAGGGAGDAKLMGALGAWLGLMQALTLLLAVSVAGIVFGLLYARSQGRLRDALESLVGVFWNTTAAVLGGSGPSTALRPSRPGAENALQMPYGVAIFFGALLASASILV